MKINLWKYLMGDDNNIKKHTFSTVLDDSDNEIFREAQEKLKVNRSEFLRLAGNYFSESVIKPIAVRGCAQQAPRGKKIPKINVNFQLQPDVIDRFKAWCDDQVPPWKYGYAVEQAMAMLIEKD